MHDKTETPDISAELFDNIIRMGSEWMTNLPDALQNLPINRLAIPGSHDSGAYDLTIEPSPDADSFVKFLSKVPCIRPLFKKIVHNIAECQRLSIQNQLSEGIRFLDLRVATKEESPDFYLVHSVYGPKVIDVLEQVREFLDEHPGEVVILDFQHFYAMDAGHHQSLIATLKSVFGSKLYPRVTSMKEMTLKNMISNKKQVICIYQDAASESHTDLWTATCIQSPWPNTTSTGDCLAKLTQYMDRAETVVDQFFVCQGVLTPDKDYVLGHLFRGSVYKLTQEFNPVFFPWLKETPTKWKQEPCIVIHDFVEEENFNQQVLDLNKHRADSLQLQESLSLACSGIDVNAIN